jgi:hypothetical protein
MEFCREKFPFAHLIDIEGITDSLLEAHSMLALYQQNVAIVHNDHGLDVMFLASVRDKSSIIEILRTDDEYGYGR